jgi:hypothetical protein
MLGVSIKQAEYFLKSLKDLLIYSNKLYME